MAGQAFVEAFRWFGFFLILERAGAAALAVGNVVFVCYEVFLVPTEAFAEAACSMVSRFVGRDRPDRIAGLIHRSVGAAALATLPLIGLGLLLPDWLLSVFTLDGSLIEASVASVRVVALAMLVVIPAEMWFTAVVGTGDTPAALSIELGLTSVMLAATYTIAVVLSGGALVWCSLIAAGLVALAASYGWMRSGRWRRALA
jgi:Na+-driven multidrug efflux pump